MIGRRAPFGVYEGAFATRNPVCTVGPNTVVGSTDIPVGRFAWADPATGQVSNVQMANGQLGVVQPRWGLWSLTYFIRGVRYVRAGKPVTLYCSGDFFLRFPQGANIGRPVYADPATGIAYATDGGGSYVLTKWKTAANIKPGNLGVISPYNFIG